MCGGGVANFVANSTGIPQLKAAAQGDGRGVAATAIGGQGAPRQWSEGTVNRWAGGSLVRPEPQQPVTQQQQSTTKKSKTLLGE